VKISISQCGEHGSDTIVVYSAYDCPMCKLEGEHRDIEKQLEEAGATIDALERDIAKLEGQS